MIQKAKGTKDVLADESYKWQLLEEAAQETFENFGLKEIRIPTFEYTELFERGVGETTDVVQKEMYTFNDKAGRSITLRPEGTAGIVRSYIENGLSSKPSPYKVWYQMPMFRYENVQKGRYREFNQIGCEIIGTSSYLADIEAINIAYTFLKKIKIEDIKLTINSIGCPKCRKEYQNALKEFIGKNLKEYCNTCQTRFEKNPMRILDCKEEKCKKLNQGAPIILDYLCDDCKEHFNNVKNMLTKLNIKYEVDPNIVRGLDYYTKTVFEFISEKDGLTVLAGGRYDGLVKELGGVDTPAVGFAAGEERLLSLIEEKQPNDFNTELYIATMSEKEMAKALELANALRNYLVVETDICSRSFNAQLKYANKVGVENLIVIGQEEIKTNIGKLKNMKTGEEKEVALDADSIFETLIDFE